MTKLILALVFSFFVLVLLIVRGLIRDHKEDVEREEAFRRLRRKK